MPPLFQGNRVASKRTANSQSGSSGSLARIHCSGKTWACWMHLIVVISKLIPVKQISKRELQVTSLRQRCKLRLRKPWTSPKKQKRLRNFMASTRTTLGNTEPRCLIARRLVERGVRFVQLFHSGQPWDNHSNIRTSLPNICRKTDKPSAALVKDLKQRGLLDSTVVHWGGEIGRLPVTENHGDTKESRA